MKFNTLNDGTKGFRFNVLGQQGLYRKRSKVSHKISLSAGAKGTFVVLHVGKRSLYWESKGAVRMLHNLAGGK
jgi:hypothetical protein